MWHAACGADCERANALAPSAAEQAFLRGRQDLLAAELEERDRL